MTDVKTLIDLIRSKLKGMDPVDDKTMLMERVIRLVAGLPSESRNRILLTNNFINELWYSLDHPPLIYVGEQYEYRMADGSYNVSYIRHTSRFGWRLKLFRTSCIHNLERLVQLMPDQSVLQSCPPEPCLTRLSYLIR